MNRFNMPSVAQRDHDFAIRDVESLAMRFETPCGAGKMVWRKWGNGRPVLLLHGGSGSWLHWLRTVPALASRYTLWVPDMPGMGESDLPPLPYSFDRYAAVIERGLRSLVPESDRLDAVGFSFGGGVAVRLARRHDGRFHHLVLSGVNFFQPTGLKRQLVSLARIDDPVERMKGVRKNLQAMLIAHERNIDGLAMRLYGLDTARRRLPRVPFSGFPSLRADLPEARVRGRISVISGADDQVVGHGRDEQAAMLRSLRPDAGYQALEGAGHWVMYEAAPDYNKALLGALEQA